MNQAEDIEGISPEQYGRITSKDADIQAFNTYLFYDLVIQKKVKSTSVFADIIYNYDLVVHIIASISLQRVNIPK